MKRVNSVFVTLILLALTYGQLTFAEQPPESTDSTRADRKDVSIFNGLSLILAQLQTHQKHTIDSLLEKNRESSFGIGYEARQQQLRDKTRVTNGRKGGTTGNNGNASGSGGSGSGGSGSGSGGSSGGGSGSGGSSGGGSGGGGSGGGGSGGGGSGGGGSGGGGSGGSGSGGGGGR